MMPQFIYVAFTEVVQLAFSEFAVKSSNAATLAIMSNCTCNCA